MIPAMSVIAHGIDMVDCARLRGAVKRHGEKFLRRVFTSVELEYSLSKKRRMEHLAGRFAAKEAVLKALGTGWRGGINWTDIEIRNAPSGQPYVKLSGKCRQIAEELGLSAIVVSISHIDTHAIASAVGERQASPDPHGLGD
jgi:holo-[acyl-carrier protein] synthase